MHFSKGPQYHNSPGMLAQHVGPFRLPSYYYGSLVYNSRADCCTAPGAPMYHCRAECLMVRGKYLSGVQYTSGSVSQ